MSVLDMGIFTAEDGEVSNVGVQSFMRNRAAWSAVELSLAIFVLSFSTSWNKQAFTD